MISDDYHNIGRCVTNGKIVMISDDYHNIGRLLLLMNIANSKNWTILIIVKKYHG